MTKLKFIWITWRRHNKGVFFNFINYCYYCIVIGKKINNFLEERGSDNSVISWLFRRRSKASVKISWIYMSQIIIKISIYWLIFKLWWYYNMYCHWETDNCTICSHLIEIIILESMNIYTTMGIFTACYELHLWYFGTFLYHSTSTKVIPQNDKNVNHLINHKKGK